MARKRTIIITRDPGETGESTAEGLGATEENVIDHASAADSFTIDPEPVEPEPIHTAANTAIDPTELSGTRRRKRNKRKRDYRAEEAQRRAKRAAESGPTAEPPKAKAQTNPGVKGLESLLMSVHLMGAAILREPDLAIDPKEAAALAEAAENVLQYYPHSFDPKTAAWFNLGIVCMGVYGTRAATILRKHKASAAIPKLTGQTAGTPPPPAQPAGASIFDFADFKVPQSHQ